MQSMSRTSRTTSAASSKTKRSLLLRRRDGAFLTVTLSLMLLFAIDVTVVLSVMTTADLTTNRTSPEFHVAPRHGQLCFAASGLPISPAAVS